MNQLPIVLESQFFPPVAYFTVLYNADTVIIDPNENFVKQTYRNRCVILGANGKINMTVPVIGGRKKVKVKEIKIDNSQSWAKIHWRSIQSAYGKAPFFEFLADELHLLFRREYKFLFDLNHDVLSCCLRLLQLPINITYAESYIGKENADYQDFRSLIRPNPNDESTYIFTPKVYTQLFGSQFVKSLSIIDLLFCEGSQAPNIIASSDVDFKLNI